MKPNEKAETAAREVVVWARRHGNEPITRDMIDAILSRDADMPWADAHVRTVRMWVRRIAILSADVVALTDREEVAAHRARFARMSRDEVWALADQIAENEDDPRGWDKNFVHALAEARRVFAVDNRTDDEQAMDAVHVGAMGAEEIRVEFTRVMDFLADSRDVTSGSAARLAGRLWREMAGRGVQFA